MLLINIVTLFLEGGKKQVQAEAQGNQNVYLDLASSLKFQWDFV